LTEPVKARKTASAAKVSYINNGRPSPLKEEEALGGIGPIRRGCSTRSRREVLYHGTVIKYPLGEARMWTFYFLTNLTANIAQEKKSGRL